jgi:hypothetical protein
MSQPNKLLRPNMLEKPYLMTTDLYGLLSASSGVSLGELRALRSFYVSGEKVPCLRNTLHVLRLPNPWSSLSMIKIDCGCE